MSFAAITVFEIANLSVEEPVYRVDLLSETGGLVRSSSGLAVDTEAFDERALDTLIICAATQVQPSSPAVLAFVRRAAQTARRVAAPCTGAFVLAEAGMLDGRRASTHWLFARRLQRRFPLIKVEADRIFIVDGNLWTSAGMTAAVDLALALVEKDLGPEIARTIAKSLVVYHRRTGGQSQFSALSKLEPSSDRIQKALEFARRHLGSALSVEVLAEAASLSVRQFSRAFHAETGQTPAKAVESLRVEQARLLIEQGRLSMDRIAVETGFVDPERMRRAFLRCLGQPPQAIRRQSRAALEH